MKVKISLEVLHPVLPLLSKVLSQKSVYPITDFIYVGCKDDTLVLSAISDESHLLLNLPVDECVEVGETVVSGDTFLKTLQNLTTISVRFDTADDNSLFVKAGKSRFKVATADVSEWPKYKKPNGEPDFTISGLDIKDVLSEILFVATAKSAVAENLDGVYLDITQEAVTFVTTDKYKLGLVKKNVESNSSTPIYIPTTSASILNTVFSNDDVIHVYKDNNKAHFLSKNKYYAITLKSSSFPNYRSIIRKDALECKFIVNKSEMLQALNILLNYSRKDLPMVDVVLSGNKLKLSSKDDEYGVSAEHAIDVIETTCGSLDLRFNTKYLREIVSHTDSDNVRFFIQDNRKVLYVVGKETMFLLMAIAKSNVVN